MDDLFALRRIPWMLQMAGTRDSVAELKKLKTLQASIYALDQLLETEWKIDHDKLNQSWDGILASLKTFNIEFPDATNWCDEINRYLHHELDLRSHKSPLRFTLKYYYYYKSCDIKLLRKLIYYKFPSLKEDIEENDWIHFDLITEIFDDLEDLVEDCKMYNASYFLYSLKFFGPDKTNEIYRGFLDEIERSIMSESVKNLSTHKQELNNVTRDNMEKTRSLLKNRIDEYSAETIDNALVFSEFLKGQGDE
jgi:hypothetical protein